ncbi:hypothetical protein Godav_002726 [Gossypium davidsonii]|uniref:H(+)-exporting diphosphatase n=1 Tax=Gossypium davidsonii TaxID=34287 RepID=A0A7J8SXH9_GOSDV|nr:hypothetical protein [Gossypium davidsonii]
MIFFSGSVIGSAALVSLALFGAYVSRTGIKIVDVLTPKAFMVSLSEPCSHTGKAKPDYTYCVKISTDASLCEIIPPGALVMLNPLTVGTLFGVETLASVQVAISASNTGSWVNNAKKYIEAAVKGDTKGDPLKDTSSPSFNILIKLMAVEPFVFALFFAAHGGLLFKFI